jgi:hypothetical protein
MNVPSPQPLDPRTLLRLKRIFEENGWSLEKEFEDGDLSLFERFCRFVNYLSANEIELFLSLTKEFLLVKEFSYRGFLKGALSLVPDALLNDRKSLYVVPVISPKDRGKAKSGTALLYSFGNTGVRHFPAMRSRLRDVYVDPQYLERTKETRRNSLILFVDDFTFC